jgi:hypothetical protein
MSIYNYIILKNFSNNVVIVVTGDNYFNLQILKIQTKGEKEWEQY